MNKQRRKELSRAEVFLAQASELIEQAIEEEQDYADSMPENMQFTSERHINAEDAVHSLDSARCCLQEATDYILEATGQSCA